MIGIFIILYYIIFIKFTDRFLRLYRTHNGEFTEFKKISARDVGWSILDTAFSPDGNYIVYSSWSDNRKFKSISLCPFKDFNVLKEFLFFFSLYVSDLRRYKHSRDTFPIALRTQVLYIFIGLFERWKGSSRRWERRFSLRLRQRMSAASSQGSFSIFNINKIMASLIQIIFLFRSKVMRMM